MKVFVTGGTGAIGRPALSALVSAGHTVSALFRSDEKAELVKTLGVALARASLIDLEELKSVVSGHEAIINLATAIPPNSDFMKATAW